MLTSSTPGQGAIDPLLGTTLDGRYRILRVIGEGGMGIVYEGEHALIERPVAIKVLRNDFCKRADVVERFRREAKSASRIGHPNIVDVLDFGETPAGASYFVMEMLQGQDLADVLARTGALPPERAASIVYQCCHALAAAHDKGIIHRDLKPENIFLIERDGAPDFVKIVDFGVAKMSAQEPGARRKLTRSGMIFGTPEYMSPEQATGQAPDHRVDIYALGVTMYELLTGRVPFEGETFMAVLSKHANKQVPALRDVNPGVKVSLELESVVFRALRKERGERFQQMREMAAALMETPELPALPFRLSSPTGEGRGSGPRRIGSDVPSATAPTRFAAEFGAEPAQVGSGRARRMAVSRGLALKASLAVGLLVCAAVGYAVAGAAIGSAPRASAAAPALPVEPVAGDPAILELAAQVAPSGDQQATLDVVTVHVTTKPAGASVRLTDGDEVCASTPCAFQAVRGKSIALRARRGPRQATATLSPSGATDLHLVLGAPAKRSLAGPRRGADDLKVPEMFRAER